MTNHLEPDRDQLEIYFESLFRHRGTVGYVSMRSFRHDNRVLKPIRSVPLDKANWKFLIDVATDLARRAANSPQPAVFAPPVAVFNNPNGWQAREEDLYLGLVITAELDEHPEEARQKLQGILGEATLVVKSGGQWINGGGETEDKLHLHWRLAVPAKGDDLKKLKRARALVAATVGADPSNIPSVHCLRAAGSWHRKATPRLCTIFEQHSDIEIDLDEALRLLEAEAPPFSGGNGYDYTSDYTDIQELVRRIKTGENLHPSVGSIAGKYARKGWPIETCIQLVGSAFTTANEPRYGGRWDECVKFIEWVYRKEAEKQRANPTLALTYGWDTTKPQSTGTIVRGLLHAYSLTLTYGPPKSGKSFWLIALFLAVANGDKEFLGRTIARTGPVLYVACEGHTGYWKRLKAAAISRGWKADTFPKNFILAIGRPQLIKIDGRSHAAVPHADDVLAAVAEATAKGLKPVAVAIDTVFRSVGAGNVNASDHMNAYLAALAKITDQGIALAAVHHETKSGGTPAGSVTLIAGADAIIVFGNLEDGTHSWQVEMAKDDAETKPRKFYLQVIDVGEDLDGQPAFSCVIDEALGEAPPKTTRRMTEKVAGFYDHFKAIMAEHAKPITPEIGMSQVLGMTRDKFREELAHRGGFPESQLDRNGKLTKAAYTIENNGLTSLKLRGFCSFNRLCVWLV